MAASLEPAAILHGANYAEPGEAFAEKRQIEDKPLRARLKIVAVVFVLGCIGVIFYLWTAQRRWEEARYVVFIRGDYMTRWKRETGNWPTTLNGVPGALEQWYGGGSAYAPDISRIHEAARPRMVILARDSHTLRCRISFTWLLGGNYTISVEDGTGREP